MLYADNISIKKGKSYHSLMSGSCQDKNVQSLCFESKLYNSLYIDVTI